MPYTYIGTVCMYVCEEYVYHAHIFAYAYSRLNDSKIISSPSIPGNLAGV